MYLMHGIVKWNTRLAIDLWDEILFSVGSVLCYINTLRPRQNGRHFTDGIFKCIFLNENIWISIKISLKFVPEGSINNIPALVHIMAGRRPGAKPLSEPMMVSLLTHICITHPQWVKLALKGRIFQWQETYYSRDQITKANPYSCLRNFYPGFGSACYLLQANWSHV